MYARKLYTLIDAQYWYIYYIHYIQANVYLSYAVIRDISINNVLHFCSLIHIILVPMEDNFKCDTYIYTHCICIENWLNNDIWIGYTVLWIILESDNLWINTCTVMTNLIDFCIYHSYILFLCSMSINLKYVY